MIKLIKKYYFYFPLIVFCSLYIYKSYFFAIHDFANYYFGATFLREGLFTTNIYFPYHFNKAIFDLGYNNIYVSYAPNTPFISILFLPFSYFPLAISKLIFNLISVFLFIFSIKRLSDYYEIRKEYILIIPFIFFVPIKNNILFGQIYFLLFFLLAEGIIAYNKKQYKSMSVFLGLTILLKVFPIILVGYLIFKKKIKPIIYLSISCVILLLISISINGLEVWISYFFKILPRAGNGEIAGSFVDNYQSIFMFCKRLFIFDEIENKTVIFNSPKIFKTSILLFKVSILGILYYFTKKEKNTLFIYSLWLFASILISPYGSTYSLIILVFLYFSIGKYEFSEKNKLIFFLLLFFISNISLPKLIQFPFNYFRLIFLVLLSILIIYKFSRIINFKRITITLFVCSLMVYYFTSNPKKNYLKNALDHKTPLITYDYSFKKDTLKYYFWNKNGANTKAIPFKTNHIDSSDVYLKKNQVFYKNKQLTFDNSNKLKPIINNNFIYFLSDKDRGIGFYNLSKMKINKSKSTY